MRKSKTNFKKCKFSISQQDLSTVDPEIQECVINKTNSPYVPQIFINKKYIGGYDALNFLISSGLLDDIVKK